MTEHELVEVRLELRPADAVECSEEPLLLSLLRGGYTGDGADNWPMSGDTGLLRSMNSTRGVALHAAVWFLAGVRLGRIDRTAEVDDLVGALRALLDEPLAPVDAATLGRGLPVLVEEDEASGSDWVPRILRTAVQEHARLMVCEVYVLSWIRPISAIVSHWPGVYEMLTADIDVLPMTAEVFRTPPPSSSEPTSRSSTFMDSSRLRPS